MLLASHTTTCFVRDQSGTGLRDDDDGGLVELPPYLTKRSLYRQFCNELGWDVATSGVRLLDTLT
jgi:hypothetical protein